MDKFTTSRGIALEFLSIPVLLEKLHSQHPMPAPPTYTVETATGVKEVHTHDETTLETAEDKAAWAEYQDNLKAAQAKLNESLMRVVLLRGLKVDIPANGWVKEQEYMGITVPDDPTERRMHYLQTEALATREDYEAAVAGVMGASGVPEEVIRQAEDTFRGKVGADQTSGPAPASNGNAVDDQPPVRTGARRHQKRHTGH